ncbi:MAG: HlyD family efflux transporter periplasmic adaptor subunit [Desulfovibrionaceae bacterium]|nr:HlyD family efflux transporter periplasmic adaptor subunit [Desulfovibrionaceae bacterium]
MRSKKSLILLCVFVGTLLLFWLQNADEEGPLLIYGNVDQRQIELSFLDSERIAEIIVEEGEVVQKGQVLARLETRRLEDRIKVAEAGVAAAKAQLLKLENGTRPEEKEQAKAQLRVALAELDYAEKHYKRVRDIFSSSRGQAIRKSELDEATSRLAQAKARVHLQENVLRLAEIGPRSEDISQAKALVQEREAMVLQLKNQLADAELKSPALSRINRRLLEPGDMASPQKAVFSLVVLTPKWVRAYIAEKHMALIHPGSKAKVHADSVAEPIPGRVTFIGQVAEFTPKNVETTELRTALVYEVRITVQDTEDKLRLGMPVTVRFEDYDALYR